MKKDAIEELYRLYYNDAFLYTLTVAGDKQTAADAVSGAFYKALLTADDRIKDFKSWLLRVCRNEVYSALRKNRRLVRLSDDERAALKDESESAIEGDFGDPFQKSRCRQSRAVQSAFGT